MAYSSASQFGRSRGPHKNTGHPDADWFRASRMPSSPTTPTQGIPQAYARQGQAQSIPPQSQGTPYQPRSHSPAGDMNYAGGSPYFDVRTGRPSGPALQPYGGDTLQSPPGVVSGQQPQVRYQAQGMSNGEPAKNDMRAMQGAGLGGGAPSMSADYGDNMIQRLNQSFGGLEGDPRAFANQQPQVTPYQPFVNPQGQQFQGTMSFAPGTSQAYQNQAYGNYANQQGYYQPQVAPAMTQQAQASIPSQGTLPQPQNAYSPVSTVSQPPQAPAGPASPSGPPVTDRPAPSTSTPPREGIDANRLQFLQDKAAGNLKNPAATYGDHVNSGLDDALDKVLKTPSGAQIYQDMQGADPKTKKLFGDNLRYLVYKEAERQGVAPADEWITKKTGKSAAEGKDQYFNDAMGRYAATGKAQSIQPPSKGTPYGQPDTFKPYDGPVGRPWWELPGAGRLTAGDPIVEGLSFTSGRQMDIQAIERYHNALANGGLGRGGSPAAAAPQPATQPAATKSAARPWQSR